jgi:hypothetical protein
VRDFRMHGRGTFASTSPWYTFVGVFDNDVPVSGALTENNHLDPQPMNRIEQTSILSQKPKELDAATKAIYDANLKAQRSLDRSKVKALDTSGASKNVWVHYDKDGTRREEPVRDFGPDEM